MINSTMQHEHLKLCLLQCFSLCFFFIPLSLKKYFERLAEDLEVYATHAKRKTIEVEDFELLMRR